MAIRFTGRRNGGVEEKVPGDLRLHDLRLHDFRWTRSVHPAVCKILTRYFDTAVVPTPPPAPLPSPRIGVREILTNLYYTENEFFI